jgi:hypothetical protein
MDEYFIEDNETNKEKLMKSIKNYYFDWKSPITVWKILWDNFILAYYWIFFLYAGLILWGILTLKFTTLMYVSSFSVIIVLVIEGFFFFRIKGFSIKE